MDAQAKTKKSAVRSPTDAVRRSTYTIEESGESSTGRPTLLEKAVPTCDQGSKKRPRETNTTDFSDTALISPSRSPLQHSKIESAERARKKARVSDENENEARNMFISMCLQRLERVQIQSGNFQSLPSAQDLRYTMLETLLRQLKTVDPKAYGRCMANVHSVGTVWHTTCKSENVHDADLAETQQQVVEAAIAVFNCDNLIKLHPYLAGNSQLQNLLQSLDIPLEQLRDRVIEFDCIQNKSMAQRQRLSEVEDFLNWLSKPRPYPPLPKSTSYNDTTVRMRFEDAMMAEADRMSLPNQGTKGLPGHMSKQITATTTSSEDPARQSQHHFESFERAASTLQSEMREQIQILTAQVSSLKDTKYSPQHSQGSNSSQSTMEPSSHGKVFDLSAQKRDVTSQQQTTCSPEEEAAFIEARAQPHRKAVLDAAQQYPEKLAKYVRLQTWGEAYNIIIDELICAENGGPPSMHLGDLQVPDSTACYHRLQALWVKLAKIMTSCPEIDALRINVDTFYEFAMCLGEAHYLFRVVSHHRNCYFTDVLATGWDLEFMRILQMQMVDYVHEEPLLWSKRDVDAICTALHEASRMLTENGAPVSFAAKVAAQNASLNNSDESSNANQAAPQQQVSSSSKMQNGQQLVVLPVQSAHAKAAEGNPDGQFQVAVPNLQMPNTDAWLDLMDVDNVSIPIVHQNQTIAASFPDPNNINDYCNNRANNKCHKKNCKRIHQHVPPHLRAAAAAAAAAGKDSAPTDIQTYSKFQPNAGKSSIYCRYLAKGSCRNGNNCEFSHDPALNPRNMQQPIGDITMNGAASNGDNRGSHTAAAQQTNFNRQCRNEQGGSQPYNNLKCMFKHVNADSWNFGRTAQIPTTGIQSQPRNNQSRAPNDYTFNTIQQNMNNLGSLLPPQTQQDQHSHHSQGRGQSNNQQASRPPLQCYNCGQLGHKSNQCQQPSNNGVNNRKGGDVIANYPGYSRDSSWGSDQSNQGYATHGDGQQGNNARQANYDQRAVTSTQQPKGKNRRGKNDKNAGCHNCGQLGHFARDCHN